MPQGSCAIENRERRTTIDTKTYKSAISKYMAKNIITPRVV
jgi:hypothetical protein